MITIAVVWVHKQVVYAGEFFRPIITAYHRVCENHHIDVDDFEAKWLSLRHFDMLGCQVLECDVPLMKAIDMNQELFGNIAYILKSKFAALA